MSDISIISPYLKTEIARFFSYASQYPASINLSYLSSLLPKIDHDFTNPNTERFEQALSFLPSISPSELKLNQDCPQIGSASDLTLDQTQLLQKGLRQLMPWRKGPLQFFDTRIDAEWQSNLKWDRIKPFLPELKGKKILDIGCNNGYYLFRMLSENPDFLLGIDPMNLCFYQYLSFARYLNHPNLFYLPIGIDQLSLFKPFFNIVFCMGVLYHRKSPIDCLIQMKSLLKKKGLLIIETLTYPGEDSIAFSPKDRYAKMPNVYFLPTVSCLTNWLVNAGFHSINVVSTAKTTSTEQRRTSWMNYDSLAANLNPNHPNQTIEGYPAPQRTIVFAYLK